MRNEHLNGEQFQGLLDGRVSDEEARAWRTHLDGCEPCASEMAAFAAVFEALGHVAAFSPSSGFADRVIEVVVPVTDLGSDLLVRGHVTTEALLDYLDAALSPAAHGVVERHVAACGSCRDLETEWSQVFRELGTAERFAPSADFREGVLAQLPSSVLAPAAPRERSGGMVTSWVRGQARSLVARVQNKGRGRWAVLAGVGTAPAAVVASVSWVVLSHPLVTMAGLVRFAWLQATQVATGLGGVVFGGVVESAATYQLWTAIQSLASTPLVALLGVAFVCAVLSSSVWVLFRNLAPIYRNLIPIRLAGGRYARVNV